MSSQLNRRGVARFALAALTAAGVGDEDITVIRVPGAFEIPTAARLAANTHAFDGIICLGCLIRGATPHFEYISSAVALGLTSASGETGVPMAFGVLTTNSAEEALERARARTTTTLIAIRTDPRAWSDGGAFWEVGLGEGQGIARGAHSIAAEEVVELAALLEEIEVEQQGQRR